MGTCYTYLLFDDFDWGYRDRTKKEIIERIKEELPVATIEAQWYKYIVVDLDKCSPWRDSTQKLSKYCDSAKYYTDSAPWELRDVEFKKDPVEVANEPENRNAKHITEAFEDWKRRYYEKDQDHRSITI